MTVRVLTGDCRDVLKTLPDESVHSVVTSPPYWGLRDYGVPGQLGLEDSHLAYIGNMAGVFREVRRVLRGDGTLWLNLGDSYAGSWGAQSRPDGNDAKSTLQGGSMLSARQIQEHPKGTHTGSLKNTPGLKAKDLCGIPWRVALALQADGWYLRSDIIWAKRSCMPESVEDRPTRAHEYLFLLARSERYFYDADAIREPDAGQDHPRNVLDQPEPSGGVLKPHSGIRSLEGRNGQGRNKRSVWSPTQQPFREAHFATFPPALIEPCILAGCPAGGVVLDPFGGAGTTGLVADRNGRDAILIELNPEYAEMARKRITNDSPLFADVE